jgi:hypothetical protein
MVKLKEKYTVIRDGREKVGHGWMFKEDENCAGTIIQSIPTGDYTILGHEESFVIERKATTAELCNNMYEKRFERELERLDSFAHPFIICEFSFADVIAFPVGSSIPKSLWHKVSKSAEFLHSSIVKWQIQHKVKIIFAGQHGDLIAQKIFKYIAKYGKKS